MTDRIVVDPGHGGVDPGATYGNLQEKDIALSVSRKLTDELESRGIDVLLTRTADYALSLPDRCTLANVWQASVFVSIHLNADPDADQLADPSAKGSEIWIHPGSVRGRRVAQAIQEQIAIHFPGRKFRGIKEGRLAVLRQTFMPAVLIELAFIDTDESGSLLLDDLQFDIARCIADGLDNFVKMETGEWV